MSYAGEGDCRSVENGTVVYRSDGEGTDEEELSTRILMALDSVPGYDIENSDTVVFDHIDLDALDNLFPATDGVDPAGQVTFDVDQYQVTVTADDRITIRTS